MRLANERRRRTQFAMPATALVTQLVERGSSLQAVRILDYSALEPFCSVGEK